MDNNKVTVKIYGQEYVISGDAPIEQIIAVAAYVDSKMVEIGKNVNVPMSSLAVLSAINITDDYFKLKERVSELELERDRLIKDSQHYVDLWDEAKNSFIQYKQDAQDSLQLLQELRMELGESEGENRRLKEEINGLNEKLSAVVHENQLLNEATAPENEKTDSDADTVHGGHPDSEFEDLVEKCKEMESTFFDLQMENIQLKSELDRYKKIVE